MISGVGAGAAAIVPGTSGAEATGSSFGDTLEKAVDSVNEQQNAADERLVGLATGQDTNLHSTMIALEEANIALRAMTSARDKVVDAYKTIWNMQV